MPTEPSMWTRERVIAEFPPLSVEEIRAFCAPVVASADIDLILGVAHAEFLLRVVDELSADLLRFAGPICPHDGRRALDHEIAPNGWQFLGGERLRLDGEKHRRAWPEGYKWLRTRGER